MNDRELLELAAKAAGIALEFSRMPDITPRRADTWDRWNPITDDGNALRLAVKLDISVTQYPIYEYPKHSVVARRPSLEDSRTEVVELHNGDRDAATRRAIVRAAAEIGKGMK